MLRESTKDEPLPARATSEIESTVRALAAGDIRTCARLITRIERGEPEVVPVLQALYRAGRGRHVIGVTGPPGAGKSTLVGKLLRAWRERGMRVAVLAVDPSSPFSGGAVLGDRLRMQEHGCDPGVFIRSMASRGALGGLAKAAGDAITVLDAMPWDVILVETVGVGQNETDVMRHASVVVLLQTPMGGDGVQAAKAGVLEIGDIYVVNKGDHPHADRTVQQLQEMITLRLRLYPELQRPPVVKTSATDGAGVQELADRIDDCMAGLTADPQSARRRLHARIRHRVGELLHGMLEQRLRSDVGLLPEAVLDPIARRQSDPYAAAATIVGRIDRSSP